MKLEFHELANLFPMMTGDDAKALGDDIKANGQHEPIIMFEEKILDGRNRYLECIRVGVEPTFRPYLGDDPTAFVISLNLKRRHLDESQRAMIGAKLATLKQGGDHSKPSIEGLSADQASSLLNVSDASIERGRVVIKKGTPELIKAVEQGNVSVSAAAEFAKQPKEDQAKQIAEAGTPADAVKAGRAASKTPKPVTDAVSDDADPGIEDDIDVDAPEGIEDRIDGEDPENYRTAFLLRADQAVHFAAYSGPKKYNKSLAPVARGVVSAWLAIAEQLESVKAKPPVERQIDPTTLSRSAQEKLAIATRQMQKKLQASYAEEVRKAVVDDTQRRLEETILPHYKEMERRYRDLSESRTRGTMDRKTYRLILSCLHTDSRKSASDGKLNEAFNLFSRMETKLMSEKDDPTPKFKMPANMEELNALKAKVAAERKAKRGHQNVARRSAS
jgi:hypothetical protein